MSESTVEKPKDFFGYERRPVAEKVLHEGTPPNIAPELIDWVCDQVRGMLTTPFQSTRRITSAGVFDRVGLRLTISICSEQPPSVKLETTIRHDEMPLHHDLGKPNCESEGVGDFRPDAE